MRVFLLGGRTGGQRKAAQKPITLPLRSALSISGSVMSLRLRTRSGLGFIVPARLPRRPPFRRWILEIKHDGFRILARHDGAAVRLFSRLYR